jgi:predicted metal-dependent phosphoesterase TrpH
VSADPVQPTDGPATVDLHLHTIYSDGRWSPREVIDQAAARGLRAVAVADHDVLGGLEEAASAAAERSIEFLPAIELTADWEGRACHVLGYGIDPTSLALQRALESGQRQMAAHVATVLEAIRAAGFDLSDQDLARYNTRYPTGTSLVLAMLERGILRRAAGGRRLLALAGQEPRAYSVEQAIALIHQAGGLAVLAHPARLRRQQPLLRAEDLAPLVDWHLDGLEVWHVLQRGEVRAHYSRLAEELGLLPTGGSDCHGPRSSGVRIGSQAVPYRVFIGLRERLPPRPPADARA